jgi:hypothetical protein
VTDGTTPTEARAAAPAERRKINRDRSSDEVRGELRTIGANLRKHGPRVDLVALGRTVDFAALFATRRALDPETQEALELVARRLLVIKFDRPKRETDEKARRKAKVIQFVAARERIGASRAGVDRREP